MTTCSCCGRGPLVSRTDRNPPPGALKAAAGKCRTCYYNERDGKTCPHEFIRTDAVLEDVAFMAEHGESMEGAAKRVGLKRDSLLNLLTKHGATEVRDRLLAQEWRVSA